MNDEVLRDQLLALLRGGHAHKIDFLVKCRRVKVTAPGFDIRQFGHSGMLLGQSLNICCSRVALCAA